MKIPEITNIYKEFQKWKKLVNKTNRFNNSSKLLQFLYDKADLLSVTIEKESTFYRGRIFDLENRVFTNKQYEKWLQEDCAPFYGFSKKECGAPPTVNNPAGRLNTQGISFLYTCKDELTVIYELRPTLLETISISKFHTNKSVKIADLTKDNIDTIQDERFKEFVQLIAREFATPHYAGHTYYFTQYLAGQFINMGFDGIAYNSSLNKDGKNYVFFKPNNLDAVNSYLCEVDEIVIYSSQITSRLDMRYDEQ